MTELPSYNRVAADVRLGTGVRLFGFVNLYGCVIGDETRIGAFVEVQKNVSIGARCKISSHTFICEGVTIEDEVFVGHGVMFLNDTDPRAAINGRLATEHDWKCLPVRVCKTASIGSGAVILGGVTIGEGALVGAGAVVTKDVDAHSVVAGIPARLLRSRVTDGVDTDMTDDRPELDAKPLPLTEPRRQLENAALRDQILAAVTDVIDSGAYVLGPYVASFERSFAASVGNGQCIAVNSGTSALHLALIAAGVGPGDEVITSPLTFVSTAWAISYIGAKPVFADIDPDTFCIDPREIAAKITSRTKAIVPVHLYGQCADLDSILSAANERGIPVIEDAAQAAGALYGGKPAGGIGLLGCFSFYPSKNLGACGEGGAIVTNDDAIAARVRNLRDHAQPKRGHHEELGFNYRMDAIQGAVLGAKLPYTCQWTEKRRERADRYHTALKMISADVLKLPTEAANCSHSWHLYSVRHENRDWLKSMLAERGITTASHYPIPVHLQPAYAHLGHRPGDFPVAENVANHCLSLPLFAEMTDAEQDRVIAALSDLCSNAH